MVFEKIILKVVESFLESFNKRDFEELRKLLSNDFYLISDTIIKFRPENTDGKISGAENVIEFWKELTVSDEVKIEPGQFQVSSEGKHVTYTGSLLNGLAFESHFVMNEYAKIESMVTRFSDLL